MISVFTILFLVMACSPPREVEATLLAAALTTHPVFPPLVRKVRGYEGQPLASPCPAAMGL